MLLLMLATRTGWLQVEGLHSMDYVKMEWVDKGIDLARHLGVPSLVVGLTPLAGRMWQMRGNLLDVLRLDYVTTARAKGLSENVVVFKHALRNAINPLITLFGYTLGSGALIVEIIFSWPGLGRITFDALLSQDQYLVLGSVMMASFVLIMGNL